MLGFDDRSGWVLDQTGSLLRFGAAPPGRPSRIWLADAARGIGLAADGLSGAVVDRDGTVARFTSGPATRAIALRGDGVSGYTLDASGRLRAFGARPSRPARRRGRPGTSDATWRCAPTGRATSSTGSVGSTP